MLKSKNLDFLKHVHKHELLDASKHIGLDEPQAETLWEKLSSRKSPSTIFNVPNVIYCLGATIICIAFLWFAARHYSNYGPTFLFCIAFMCGAIFYGLGFYLWKVKKNQFLGGLGIFCALFLVPFITYSFQDMVGWWPHEGVKQISLYGWVKGGWLVMETTTLVLALVSFYFIRFPLLTVILYLTSWYMCVDNCPMLFNSFAKHVTFGLTELREAISILFGLGVMIVGYIFDQKKLNSFAFWAYLFGLTLSWVTLTIITIDDDSNNWFTYFFLNFAMIALSPILKRKMFLVFGVMGSLGYFLFLSQAYFASSVMIPFTLTLVGLGLIAITFALQRYKIKAPRVKGGALDASVVD